MGYSEKDSKTYIFVHRWTFGCTVRLWMPFRILSTLVNLGFFVFFFIIYCMAYELILRNLGLWFPYSIVCIQLLYDKGRNRFPQHPTFKFWVPWRASASFCFMEFHTLNLSWIVSWVSVEFVLFTPEGQGPAFVLHSPAFRFQAGELLVFVFQ